MQHLEVLWNEARLDTELCLYTYLNRTAEQNLIRSALEPIFYVHSLTRGVDTSISSTLVLSVMQVKQPVQRTSDEVKVVETVVCASRNSCRSTFIRNFSWFNSKFFLIVMRTLSCNSHSATMQLPPIFTSEQSTGFPLKIVHKWQWIDEFFQNKVIRYRRIILTTFSVRKSKNVPVLKKSNFNRISPCTEF